MSNWTHVACVFRVDDMSLFLGEHLDFDKVFGKECIWGSDTGKFRKEYDKAVEHPEKYLPIGSEGSLHKSVWINPDQSSISQFVVTVWGDLRDHDSLDDIETWFRKCCDKLDGWVRQATCLVSNELNGSRTVSFSFGKEIKQPKKGKNRK